MFSNSGKLATDLLPVEATFVDQMLQILLSFTRPQKRQDSDMICQDLTISNKINHMNAKLKPACAICWNGSLIARLQNKGAAASRRMASTIIQRLIVVNNHMKKWTLYIRDSK